MLVAWLVAKGLDEQTAGYVSGAVLAVTAAVWSWLTNSKKSMIDKTANLSDVQKVVTTHEIASASPSEKVTNGFVAPDAPATPKTKP